MKRKNIIFSLGGCCIFLAALPTLCSTNFGKNIITSVVKKSLKAAFNLESLSLSWLGPQVLEGIEYSDEKCSLNCEKITLNEGLLQLAFHPKRFSSIEITSPKIDIYSSFSVVPLKKDQASFLPSIGEIYFSSYKELLPFTGRLHITKGSLQVARATFSSIEIDAILKGETEPSSISISIDALHNSVKGKLALEATLGPNPTITAEAIQFPIEGIDETLSYFSSTPKEALVKLIGPTLNMQCTLNASPSFFNANLAIKSDQISSSLQLQTTEGKLVLSSPASLDIILSPIGANLLNENIHLVSPLALSLKIPSFSAPLEQGLPVVLKAALSLTFSSAPCSFSPQLQAQLQGEIQTPSLEKELSLKVAGQIQATNTPSPFNAIFQITNPLSASPNIESSIQTAKIPTKLIEDLSGVSITSWIGDWIELAIQANGSKEKATANCKISTPILSSQAIDLSWDEGTLSLQNPTTLLYHAKNPLIQEPVEIIASIESARLNKKDIAFKSHITLSAITFTELGEKKRYQLPASTFDINASSLSSISFSFTNPTLSFQGLIGYSPSFVHIKTPLTFTYELSEANLPFILPSYLGIKESTVTVKCMPIKVSLQDLAKTPPIEMQLSMTPLTLINRKTTLSLENMLCKGSFGLLDKTLSMQYQMNLASPQTSPSPIKGSIIATSPSDYTADLSLDKLPVTLIEGFMQGFVKNKINLSSVLGEELSSSFKISNKKASKEVSLKFTSPFLALQGSFGMQNDSIVSLAPFSAQYSLTPKGYSSLIHSPFNLQNEANVSVSIEKLVLPTTLDITQVKVAAKMSTSSISLQTKESGEPLVISNCAISVKKETQAQDLAMLATFYAEEGACQIKAQISQLSPIQASLDIKMDRLPSRVLDFLLLHKRPFYPVVLGSSFSATCQTSLTQGQGPLSLSLSSPKAHLSMEAAINDSSITLKKDLTADILATPELVSLFLKTDSPLTSLSAPRPITLWVAQSGFSFPINRNPSSIQIPRMQINLGKIYSKNEGALASALEQLKSKESKNKEIEIWFAPLDINIKQGIIGIERTEFLLDKRYDMAFWGQVDLVKNYAELILGITAGAMKEAFGMGQLPKDYVLKIPVEGPLDNIQIKKGVASSKIAALLLWQSDLLSKVAGPFGGVLKQVIPPPGGEGKTPPAKHPFPWEDNRNKK
jgi:hypothetical protein